MNEDAFYAQIGRIVTQFNLAESMIRLAFEKAVDTKFGALLGHVQSISTRIDMVETALTAIASDRPWAANTLVLIPRLRELVTFRNELAHATLIHRGASILLLLKLFDTGKRIRQVELTLDDLTTKRIAAESLIVDWLTACDVVGSMFAVGHDIKRIKK